MTVPHHSIVRVLPVSANPVSQRLRTCCLHVTQETVLKACQCTPSLQKPGCLVAQSFIVAVVL